MSQVGRFRIYDLRGGEIESRRSFDTLRGALRVASQAARSSDADRVVWFCADGKTRQLVAGYASADGRTERAKGSGLMPPATFRIGVVGIEA